MCEASPVALTLSSLWHGEPSGTKMLRNTSWKPKIRQLLEEHSPVPFFKSMSWLQASM